MRVDLRSPFRKRVFLMACAGVLLLAFALCCQAIVDDWLSTPRTLDRLTRAARLQPLNADHQLTIGAILLDSDFQASRVHLQKAVSINPHSSRAWLLLANAYEALGDDQHRRDAVRHALDCEPKDTQVQWEAANLFLDTDLDRSLQLLRGVVESDPSYGPTAMAVAFRASNDNVDRAMLAIPLETTPRLQFMHWLLDRNRTDAADRVWPTVLTAPGPLQVSDIFFYLDSLIARHEADRAFAAWTRFGERDPILRNHLQPGNLISNGDFEGDLLNGGFGWRYSPVAGVTPSLDTSTFHGGNRSLELQIDGADLQDFGFRQLVNVERGAHYRLSGWLHAEELEAASGVRLAVDDAYSNSQLLLTDEALGSFAWREFDGEFTAPANTNLVTVFLTRSPANGRIRGKLWIDDVRIEKR